MKAGKNIDTNKQVKKVQIEEDYLCGEIKFRKDRRQMLFRIIFKGMTYVLVAAISGSISGIYVANQKSNRIIPANTTRTALLQQNQAEVRQSNTVTRIAADIGQSIVGISNNNEGKFCDNDNENISGVIFKSNGYIITSYSQMKGNSNHIVKLSKNTKPIEAKMIGYDTVSNLAVLKIDRRNLPTAVFGNASKVQIGNIAVAIGNNNGEFTSTVTAGIVSAFNRRQKVFNINTGDVINYNVIQTDAEINESNVGGVLCNEQGEVIGINQKDKNGKNGYAIEIGDVQRIVDAIIKNGHVSRPYAGLVSDAYVSSDKKKSGVLVKRIIEGTGAQKAGVKVNDIIVEFDMLKVKSGDEINNIIQRHNIGDVVPCKILRDGKYLNIKVTISEAPANDD